MVFPLPLSQKEVKKRGNKFTSKFLKLFGFINLHIVYSTSHHHSNNGQMERLNAIVIQALRCL